MLKAKLTCVALALMLAAPAFCQQPTMSPAWNLDGLVMMGGRLLGKTPDDQDSILRVTGQKAQELRIARIRTPAGHMFIVQGLGQPLCSALGNCTSWVLDKDYHVLLTTDAESFRLQESQTPGQLDIVTYQPEALAVGRRPLPEHRLRNTHPEARRTEAADGAGDTARRLREVELLRASTFYNRCT
jgi:hypothetical protein